MTLIVCSLRRIDLIIRRRSPSHLITLLSPGEMINELPIMRGRHLRLGINDINEPADGLIAPDEATVDAILNFGAQWDEKSPMLIHCWAGISRSSATAFILACERNPDIPEQTIAERLRSLSPIAHPNALLVSLADKKLGRDGRMTRAVAAIGPGRAAFENEPFELPARFSGP